MHDQRSGDNGRTFDDYINLSNSPGDRSINPQCAAEGNTVYVMPPYITGADQIRGLADTLRICLDDPAV